MLVIIGYLVVIGSVFGGYALAGGHLAALWQPLELLMIGGAAFGSMITGNNGKTLKLTMKALPTLFKSPAATPQRFLELLMVIYAILNKIRKQGLFSIESDIDNPHQSPIFSAYPNIEHDHHIMDFFCDYLRLMISGSFNTFEIEALMDAEIDTIHAEEALPATAISKMGEGMPAFGIVAAVMGVVHTMGSLDQPPTVLGVLIAHALVGTFLGILLSYGFISPLSQLMEQNNMNYGKMFECIKVCLLASFNGYAPQIAVEFGRKILLLSDRPSARDLEEKLKELKNK